MNARERLVFAAGRLLQRGFAGDVGAPAPEADERERFLRLAAVYGHAFENVPAYRRKYEAAGLTAGAIASPSDVARIPALTKAELGAGLKANPGAFAVRLDSGGTAGRKSSAFLSLDYVVKRYAMLLRILYSLGWEMGLPVSALHPVEYGYWNNLAGMIERGELAKALFEWVQQCVVYGMLHNRRNILYAGSAFEAAAPSDALAKALGRRPALLISRPDILAYLLKRGGAGAAAPRVPCALLVGSLAVRPLLKRVEDSLGCRAANLYASTEAGYVGLACRHSGEWVHIDTANYWVEIDPAQDNEILVTDFNNYGMPLIRYRTGDVGQLKRECCPCGRAGPLLRLRGRKGRCLRNERGETLFEADVMEHFEDFPVVWAYQLAAEPDGGLLVRLRSAADRRLEAQRVVDGFCERFGFDRGKTLCDHDSPLLKSPSGKVPCLAAGDDRVETR